MAEKTAVFSLKVDTGKSVQDIQAFDKAVEDLNKELKDTSKTATEASTQGMDQFDQKLAELNQRLEDGGLTMREMTKLMKEYQNLAARAGGETPIGQQAIQNAASLKDEIGDLKAQTTALSSDFVGLDTALKGVETGAAAFQGIQSAAALAGVENEDLIKTMTKLQAIQGVVNAVSIIANNLNKEAILGIQLRNAFEKVGNFIRTGTITGLGAQATAQGVVTTATTATTVATKALRAALVATGIGAIVVLLGLAADAMGLFGDETEDAEEKQKELDRQLELTNNTIERQSQLIDKVSSTIEGRVQDEINAAKKRGASEQELTKIAREGAIDRLNFLKKEEEEASKFYLKKTKDLKASNKEIDAAEQAFIKINTERIKLKRQIETEDANKEFELIKDRQKRQKDASEKRIKAQQEEAKRLADLARKANEERIRIEDERFALSLELMKDGFEKELQQLVIQRDKRMDQAHGDKELEAQVEMEFLIAKADLQKKYSDQELAKLAETEQRKRDIREKYTRLFNSDKDNELMDLRATYESEKDIVLDALKAGLIDEEEYLDKENQLTEKYRKKKAEIDKKYNDIAKDQSDKQRDETIANIQKALETAQKYFDEIKKVNEVLNQLDQNRLDKIAANRDADLANLDKNLKAQLNQEGLTADQKKQIEQNFAQQKYQIELKAYQEEEKIKKAQFIRDKALRIGQIAMDTASGVMKAVAASPLTFGAPWSIFTGALGIAQAAIVASQQYKAGTMPSAPQISGGGGGDAGAGASSFTANTNAQQTDLTALGQGQSNNMPTTQVVVLESDITGTQNKVEVQEAKSTF